MKEVKITVPKNKIDPKGELTEKQQERALQKYVDGLNKKAVKMFDTHLNNTGFNTETAEALLLYLTECPQAFVFGFWRQNRDFIKWSLQKNIDINKKIIAKISAIEKKYDLPLHPADLPQE